MNEILQNLNFYSSQIIILNMPEFAIIHYNVLNIMAKFSFDAGSIKSYAWYNRLFILTFHLAYKDGLQLNKWRT
jgi:hypothetical protein